MEKRLKVIMLPTEKASRIWINNLISNDSLILEKDIRHTNTAQHLYLVSDEEIKEGDLYIHMQNGSGLRITKCISKNLPMDAKKVIATTDKSLGYSKTIEPTEEIKHGWEKVTTPLIPESFVKYFVEKNGKVDEIEIEYTSQDVLDDDIFMDTSLYPKLTDNNEVIIHLPEEEMYSREEVGVKIKEFTKEYTYEWTMDDINKWIEENLNK